MYHPGNAIVIGAGLSGLATSIGLAKLGFHVDLVEKRSSYEIRGSAFGLAPNGVKALRELLGLDVVEKFVEKEGILITMTGGYMIGWWVIREALLREVERISDRIHIRMGWNLKQIENDQQSVRAYFEERGGNDEYLEGSILIAADGIHSAVRKLLGLHSADDPPASHVWRGVLQQVPSDSILYPYLSKSIAPLGPILLGPSILSVFSFHEKLPGVMAWVVTSKAPDINAGTNIMTVLEPYFGDDTQQEQLIRELLRLSSPAELDSVYANTVVRLPDVDGGGWGGNGRVVLIGDAAHAMRPANGQGGSMAFEDAQLLCRKLKEVGFHDNDDLVEENDNNNVNNNNPSSANYDSICQALRNFENERLVRVRKIWQTEWDRAEAAYDKNKEGQVGSSALAGSDYNDWVFRGI